MLSNLVSMINNSLRTNGNLAPVQKTAVKSNNPFAENEKNPFLSTSYGSSATYGKNRPIQGGYFAGYYNGKPNIVGRRLFIEV